MVMRSNEARHPTRSASRGHLASDGDEFLVVRGVSYHFDGNAMHPVTSLTFTFLGSDGPHVTPNSGGSCSWVHGSHHVGFLYQLMKLIHDLELVGSCYVTCSVTDVVVMMTGV